MMGAGLLLPGSPCRRTSAAAFIWSLGVSAPVSLSSSHSGEDGAK